MLQYIVDVKKMRRRRRGRRRREVVGWIDVPQCYGWMDERREMGLFLFLFLFLLFGHLLARMVNLTEQNNSRKE